ncbi:hypothetical protein CP982_07765 [Streptomyces spectabilis]|uniref:Uncharacterized protein n=1 Tax=Streptomyces spectabilis TaxID=68270 RepID=A0A5P2X5T5_STRST|nr:hypothetical protein CP982_07765 [Streptomyces spectabilis]
MDPRPRADLEEDALARADAIAHRAFGKDESRWTAAQVDGYLSAVATVHQAFSPNYTESIIAGLTETYSEFDARMTAKEAAS